MRPHLTKLTTPHPSLTPSLSHPTPSLTLLISPSFVLSPCPLSLPFSLSHPIFHQPLLILNLSTNQPPTTHPSSIPPIPLSPYPSLTLSIYLCMSPPTPSLSLSPYIFLSPYPCLTLSLSHPIPPLALSLSHPIPLSLCPPLTLSHSAPLPPLSLSLSLSEFLSQSVSLSFSLVSLLSLTLFKLEG